MGNRSVVGLLPRFSGGYRLIGPAPGADPAEPVYEARSLERGDRAIIRFLDRDALGGVTAVARAARRAFAASLLDHPALVRVRALGKRPEGLLVAWGLVDGPTLAEQVERGLLDRRMLVAAVLQVARALDHMHQHGLAHGHVDASRVRHEGLGRYRLLEMGRPPPATAGAEAIEAAQNQDRQALGHMVRLVFRRPDHDGSPRDDPEFARVANRLTGDDEEPYRDVAQAVRALEGILAVPRVRVQLNDSGSTQPLIEAALCHRDAPAAQRRRRWLLYGGIGWAAFLALAGLLGFWGLVLNLIVVALMLGAAHLVVSRVGQGGDVWTRRLRSLALGLRGAEAVIAGLLALIALALLIVLGWLGPLAAVSLLLLGAAAAWRHWVDIPVDEQRTPPAALVAAVVEDLRWQGLDDAAIAGFLEKACGAEHSAFLADVGPMANLSLSRTRQPRGLMALGLDRLARELDRRLAHRRDDRLQTLFRQTEEARIAAEGVNLLTARRRSRRIAAALVARGQAIRERRGGDSPALAIGPYLDEAVRDAEKVLLEHDPADAGRPSLIVRLAQAAFGPGTRLLAGALLLAGWVLWLHQNGLIPGGHLGELARQATTVRDLQTAQALGRDAADTLRTIDPERAVIPLQLPGLPRWASRLIQGYGPLCAGAILVVSSFVPGAVLSVFAVPGAMLALLGPRLGLPSLGPIPLDGMGPLLGVALLVIGLVLRRHTALSR